MATKFTFPKAPRVGDRLEIVSVSEEKMPINIVGNSEASKNLTLIFSDQIFTGAADGETIITTLNDKNVVYDFKCVSTKDSHSWVAEGTILYNQIRALAQRVEALEQALTEVAGI